MLWSGLAGDGLVWFGLILLVCSGLVEWFPPTMVFSQALSLVFNGHS
jgi:hypothetical protein